MADAAITLRLTISDPVAGVSYSLQNQDNARVGTVMAGNDALSFDVPVRLSADNRLLGPFVRREGPQRRFVYVVIRGASPDPAAPWNRRAKIDIHDISPVLLDKARAGQVLETVLPGRARDGSPACATVRSPGGWQALP